MSRDAYDRALEEQKGAKAESSESLVPAKNAVPLLVSNPYSNTAKPFNPFIEDKNWGNQTMPAVDFVTSQQLTNNTIAMLTSGFAGHGITVYAADEFRFKIDYDRKPNSFNPALGERPKMHIYADEDDVYAANGMGVVWQRVPGDLETPLYIGDNEPTDSDLIVQLKKYERYHQGLKDLMNTHMTKFGVCHHISLQPFSNAEAIALGSDPDNIPQFVLCDGNGSTSGDELVAKLAYTITSKGYSVLRDELFPTGELTKAFASPATNAHSVQLKVAEGLYWDADRHERGPNFARFSKDLHGIFATMAAFSREQIKVVKENNIVELDVQKPPEVKIGEP